MPNMYTNPELIERRWKSRIKKVIISNPNPLVENSPHEMIFDVEQVPYDNNIPKYDQAQKTPPTKINVSNSNDIFVVFDPITRQNITISTSGLLSVIEEAYSKWKK
jgi:hypothetical protein